MRLAAISDGLSAARRVLRGTANCVLPARFGARRTGVTFLFSAAVSFGVFAGAAQAADFSPWPHKLKIAFTAYSKGETLTDFPALLVFNEGVTGFSYGQFASTNAGDLRFADSNETIELNYEIEEWNTNSSSCVWVQVPTLAGSNDYIWAYWGSVSNAIPPACTTNGATWSNGYNGVWHLQATGSSQPDSTVNWNTGTINGGATPGVSGAVNGAVNFYDADGDDYVLIPNSASMENVQEGDYSLSAFFKPWSVPPGNTSDNNAAYAIIEKTGWHTGIKYQNDKRFAVEHWTTNLAWEWQGTSSGNSFETGVFHHVQAVINRAAGITRLYVNGRQEGTRAFAAGAIAREYDTTTWKIGTANPGAGSYRWAADGVIDEARIESVARSSNWVWACWLNQASNSTFMSYDCMISNDGGASNVASSSAVLNGYLHWTDSVPSDVWVFWGQTDGGTNKAGWGGANYIGTRPVGHLATNVTGLAPDSVYYYRFCASNSVRETWAPSSASFVIANVTVQASDPSANEKGLDPGAFSVCRPLFTTNVPMTVNYTSSGSATPGDDYQALSGSVTIPAGQTGAVIAVTPVEDAFLNEPDESVTMTLAPGAYTIGSPSNATVTIADNLSVRDWRYRMKIIFSGYNDAETLVNFPALVLFGTNIAGFSYDRFSSPTGGDLRFANSNETSILNHEVEEWNPGGGGTGASYVWVQVPNLSSSNDYIWAYWGNENATNPPSYTTNGATWSAYYAGVWHMNNVNDSSTNLLRPTDIGSTNAPGKILNARGFNGNAYVNCTDQRLNIRTALTVSAWLNHDTADGWSFAYGAGGSGNWSYNVGITDDDKWGGEMFSPNDKKFRGPAAASNQWHHVALVFDPAGNEYLYCDGVRVVATSDTGPIRSSDLFFIGQKFDYGLRWKGLIDELRVSSVGRSSNWVWACWANQSSNETFISRADIQDLRRGTIMQLR